MAVTAILDLWVNVQEVAVRPRGRKPSIVQVVQSRPFVITDRVGDLRLYDEYIDVRAFQYAPGEVFATFLNSKAWTVLLSERALAYNFRTLAWHKRLTRYYSHLWGRGASGVDCSKELVVSTIFREGLRISVDQRSLARTKERFVECHRTLQRDDVIAGWRYERQQGPWPEWTVIINPPEVVRRSYELGAQRVPMLERAYV